MGGGGGLGSLPEGALRMLAGAGLVDMIGTVISSALPRVFAPLNFPMVKAFSSVLPATQTISPFATASFTLRGMTLIGSIEWKFGDGTAPVVVGNRDSTHTHQYSTPGTYTVEATSIALGKRVALATATVTVTETIAWQLTSLTLDSVTNGAVRGGGIPNHNTRVRARYDADQPTLVKALVTPGASQIIYVPTAVADTTMEGRRGIFLQSSVPNNKSLDSASRPILLGAPIDATISPVNAGVWQIAFSPTTTNIAASYLPLDTIRVPIVPAGIPPQYAPYPTVIYNRLVTALGNTTTITGRIIFWYPDFEVTWNGSGPVYTLFRNASRQEYYTFAARRP
jgi:PKD repeat protein